MLIRLLIVLLIAMPKMLPAQERIPSHCQAFAATPGIAFLHRTSLNNASLTENSVRLRFIDHAMFLLETPGGLNIVTDYTGYMGPTSLLPDVVTMNNAHSTHWTANPDPGIPHVLQGWEGEHYLDLGEVLVRNVPTDVRGYGGGVRPQGNSIFVFEAAGLCIGHLGHLHHEPDAEQYAALGRLDVVMAPVDGGLTLDLPTMTRVLQRLRSSVVIPMHWFGEASLQRFVVGMSGEFAIVEHPEAHLDLSLHGLPQRPTVVVLRPRFLD